MKYKEALEKIARVNAMDYEYQAWAKEALAQPEPWEKFCDSNCVWTDHHPDCKLSQPEQEPVAYINIEERKLEWAYKYMSWDTPTVINLPKIPLYTTPLQRKPLMLEQLFKLWEEDTSCDMPDTFKQFKHTARAIEAAHGIKE